MVESLSARVDYVESRFTACHKIKAKKGWIEECLKFFINQEPEIDNETLYAQALEQFLLADVAESSNPVIPAPISLKKEPFTLNETFVVQLLFLVDISESPYEQWRRLYNIKLDEAEEKGGNKQFQPKKKRMFKLEMTDGQKTVCAMEYVLITSLTSKLSPGVKLKIVGPLQVVNHILMLEPKNLEILGGDVDSLLVVNAYENVLLRLLGKPTTETPKTDYKENEVNLEVQREYSHIVSKPMNSTSNSNSRQPNVEKDLLEGIDFDEEDEFDLEMLMQIEQQQQQQSTVSSSNQNEATNHELRTNQLDDYDDEMPANVDFDMLEEDARRNMDLPTQVVVVEDFQPVFRRRNETLPISEPMEVIEIMDFRPTIAARYSPVPTIVIPDESADQGYRETASVNDSVPKKVARVEFTQKKVSGDDYDFKTTDGHNIVTVDQYHSLSITNKSKRAYVVFGHVNKVHQNSLKISKKHCWRLNVDITDDYSHEVLTAKFHTSVLEVAAGVSVSEMEALRKDSIQQPQLKDKLTKIIEELFLTIRTKRYFMMVETTMVEPRLELSVTKLLQESAENQRRFSKKLKDENLKKVV